MVKQVKSITNTYQYQNMKAMGKKAYSNRRRASAGHTPETPHENSSNTAKNVVISFKKSKKIIMHYQNNCNEPKPQSRRCPIRASVDTGNEASCAPSKVLYYRIRARKAYQ